jgi:hypothetical protein
VITGCCIYITINMNYLPCEIQGNGNKPASRRFVIKQSPFGHVFFTLFLCHKRKAVAPFKQKNAQYRFLGAESKRLTLGEAPCSGTSHTQIPKPENYFMPKKTMAFALAIAAAILSQTVLAETVTLQPNGQWSAFDVDTSASNSGGPEWIAPGGDQLAFQLTLPKPATLDVVDGGFSGDVFKLYDNNGATLLGQTSSAANNSYPASVGLNFDAAFANPNYSKGSFLLGAGTHTVTGLLWVSALDNTGQPIYASVGAVRLNLPAVPEPETAWLLLTGGLVTFARLRKAKSN